MQVSPLFWRFFGQTPLGSGDSLGLPQARTDLPNVLNTVFMIAGFLSVLYIIIAGYRYATSGGNPDTVRKSKDAIIYGLVGLVVSLSAVSIVSFVLGRF